MNVLITGGATGLGASITRKLASNPHHKTYFTYASSGEKASIIEQEFTNSKAIKCDFKNLNEVDNLVSSIPELDIDILVNNAYSGSFLDSYFYKTTPIAFSESFENNILPTIKITQAAIASFRKKKFGKIITILTAALTNTPPIGSSIYVANKAYLQQLSKIWATENGKFNITSNTISPAFMRTSFTSTTDERMLEQIINSHPLKKLLTTDEVADCICFLTDASQQINGIDILLNAGTNIK